MDVSKYNQAAWDNEVALRNAWTIPVDEGTIAGARRGDWQLYLTPTRPVPRDWFPRLEKLAVLCLAAGGGQQGPILAAAGAAVTVWDISPRQLAHDRRLARSHRLDLKTVVGDAADLGRLPNETFDLVLHAVAGAYLPDVRPVWREAFRVLRPGGVLIAAFENPVRHIFDLELAERGVLRVRHRLPYSDLTDLPKAVLARRLRNREPLMFGHTLEDQIGGQLAAGFVLNGFYEDRFTPRDGDVLSRYLATFAVTRVTKPTASISTSNSGRQMSATA